MIPSHHSTVRRRSVHTSTWVIAVLGAVAVGVAEVPGDYVERWIEAPHPYSDQGGVSFHGYAVIAEVSHGWPFEYLRRETADDAESVRPLTSAAWRVSDGVIEWSFTAIILDGFAGLAVICCASVAWELCRRRSRIKASQVSLRALLAGALLAAILVKPATEMRNAAARGRDILGEIDWGSNIKHTCSTPRFPLWLRESMGDRLFATLGMNRPGVVCVDWSPDKHNAIRDLLEEFPSDTMVELDGLSAPKDLERACSLVNCRNIILHNGNDLSLRQLRDLSELETLFVEAGSFQNLPITDAALGYIGNMRELRSLSLDGNFSDAGLAVLDRLRKLEHLSVRGASLGGESVAIICRLSRLRSLSVRGVAELSTREAEQLRKLHCLEDLDLQGCGVTGQAVGVLCRLPRLACVVLGDTAVTEETIRRARAEHPSVVFYYKCRSADERRESTAVGAK